MSFRQGRADGSSSERRGSHARSAGRPPAPHRFLARIALLGALLGAVIAAPARAQDPAPPADESVTAATSPATTHAPPAEATSGAAASVPAAHPPREKPRSDAQPPADLDDLSAWLEYRSRNHIAALPLEARLFHRRGVMLHQSGDLEEAARLVRGAAELDPGYIAPQLTLAEWSLVREPSQSLLRYASVLEVARQNFLLQLALSANLVYGLLQAILLGLLATALLIVVARQEQLRHPWAEWLSHRVRRGSAQAWSWLMLVVPFVVGFGLAFPTLVFLALLWPVLRVRERAIFVMLACGIFALPLLSSALDRLTLPLDEARAPLYGVALVETEPASAEHTARLQKLAAEHPDNAFLQFAAGWASRRTGGLEAAEKLYRRTLQLWPGDTRTLNNLGATLMMRGHPDEALELFQQATRADGENAAAWFNQAQVHTQHFDYRAATDALSRASAIDFELVKRYQSQGTDDGALPLIEQWIAPQRFWSALAAGRHDAASTGALPPMWRERIETRGWAISGIALLLTVLGVLAGYRMHRGLPLRTCSNCSRVVCRRCSERRRELALCPGCVLAEKRAESPDFARLLLMQVKRRRDHVVGAVQTALATLIPGLGLLMHQRTFSPLIILTGVMALLGPALGAVPPFAFEPRLALAPPGLPWPAQAACWLMLYAWSLLGYLRVLRRRRAEAAPAGIPMRTRSTSSSPRPSVSAEAA